ncbi:Cell filamentation protein fic [Candidatus Magnetobacterium bavaricum]|uniref:protein adenylyltransferase n=1 Tax=Candidatus Magnetobacterium bavaricum TaxID=29290 RepID=A0A0F3GZ75_9BACT|nr:Cell filamentation protein fic [Candidatus Magnetobacterium bavaricum]
MPMSRYSDSDHYIDEKTGVLKNRLGITTQAELEKAEASFASTRLYELFQTPLEGNFDFDHLKAIHRYIFKDLYEWAGQIRTVDIAKGGNSFAHHIHIETAAKFIFNKLADERFLIGMSKSDFYSTFRLG